MLQVIILTLFSYLLGSISSAIIISKILHLPDPRVAGSGNPGTTNVLRLGGKKAAVLTLLGDILKGVLPVLVGQLLGLDLWAVALIAIAAFLGHLYPIFFRFKGGKGVATAFGCLIVLSWQVGLLLVLTWLMVVLLFRYSSLAALTTAALGPLYMWYFTNPTLTQASCIMSGFLILRHRSNIQKLLRGQEAKLGK